MNTRSMGNSGLRVSELCLGAMNFGMPDWGIDKDASVQVIDAFLESGGNFIDTADAYGGGASEEIVGAALAGRREQVIIATKAFNAVTKRFGEPPAHANALGVSRRHLIQSLNDSLRRMKTDYVDLYQIHCWDTHTPIEETLSTLDTLVKSGKVRYCGLSNFTAWQIAESRQLCIRFHWEPLVTAQMQYSLVCRDIEMDVLPVCKRYGIGLLPWSPLGGGVLTGKYNKDFSGPSESRFGDKPDPNNAWRNRFVNERNLRIVDAVKAVAAEVNATPSAVAIAWILHQPAVSSIIVGPKSVEQWKDNLSACSLSLSETQLDRLAQASAPTAKYPEWFVPAMMRNQPG